MQITPNFNLKKIELPDSPPDITVINPNWDTIDKALINTSRFEKATGTATAITLSNATTVNGDSKTFIVASNNNGAATTINGKSLYKPGTTSAPNLIAGKAVTIWYDSTGNCFFIKASAEGDVIAENVLAGKTFSNNDDTGLTGTMTNNGAVSADLTTEGAEYTIPKGFHSGLGKIRAKITGLIASVIKAGTTVGGILGTFTSDANAGAGDVLNGKTAYVNSNKITGIMPNNDGVNLPIQTGGNIIATIDDPDAAYAGQHGVIKAKAVSSGYITPNTIIQQRVLNLQPHNIKVGVNIGGNATAGMMGTFTGDGDTNAHAILSGYKFYGKGNRYDGLMPNNGSKTYTPKATQQYVNDGYHSGSKILGDVNLIAANIIQGKSIFGVAGNATPLKFASGTKLASNSYVSVYYQNGMSSSLLYGLTVSGLTFKPKAIIAYSLKDSSYGNAFITTYVEHPLANNNRTVFYYGNGGVHAIDANRGGVYINDTGFCLPTVATDNVTYVWMAWG